MTPHHCLNAALSSRPGQCFALPLLWLLSACGRAEEARILAPDPVSASASPSLARVTVAPPETSAATAPTVEAGPPLPAWVVPAPFSALFADGTRVTYQVTDQPRNMRATVSKISCPVRRSLSDPKAAAACLDCGDYAKNPPGTSGLCFAANELGMWRTFGPIDELEQLADTLAKPPLIPAALTSYDHDATPEVAGDLESYRVTGSKKQLKGVGEAYCVQEQVEMLGPFDDTTESWCAAADQGLVWREFLNESTGRRTTMKLHPDP